MTDKEVLFIAYGALKAVYLEYQDRKAQHALLRLIEEHLFSEKTNAAFELPEKPKPTGASDA